MATTRHETPEALAELLAFANSQFLIPNSQFLDTTTWHYDNATGLLTNKVYADGNGPSYAYTPDGKLATRTWARGITTTYAYDPAGNLITVDYSDATPSIAYSHDRYGRILSAMSSALAGAECKCCATLAGLIGCVRFPPVPLRFTDGYSHFTPPA